MKEIEISDLFTASRRAVTSDGYLQIHGVLSRTGVQEYHAMELGLDGVDPMKVVRLYRPSSEVFNPKSIASFDGAPLTNDHPPEAVTASNWQKYAVGDVRNTRQEGDFVVGDITVRAKDAIESVNGGKVELSNGYRFMLDMTAGTTPSGEAYDGLQKDIKGNHVAIVAAGRCGSACRVSDSQPTPKKDLPMTTQKMVVDGIPVEVSDTVAAVIGNLVTNRDQALKLVKDTEGKLDKQTTDHAAAVLKLSTDHKAAIETLQKDVMTPEARDALVKDWAKMLEEAKRLAPAVTTDGKTCLAIRREVVASVAAGDATCKAVTDAVLAGKELATADEGTVRAVFNAVAAAHKPVGDTATAAALLGVDSQVAVVDARQLWINQAQKGA